ncbi:MAG: V-type ATP synthase subunit B [Candidatus Lambdaproteobacteria bacterium RIFOXYD1_FULL_56_27]|uniref:V-type ATP synthase subunit B n=1 Tax=Candidatus Lambdaproteobacteria bacterium RIFOXYD2_FULL_56_26 TaxID=1817773 RepID=A0A1F6GM98_9PROT|nr:MAG: V-type ATP synthase subunit B [Candidatus Lambdaproteobacteria bacterium RIFOXYD2_FULL_56_26]OGH01775.1 MAG: V-type ATP synthase subunit B [Candidatus Lambdaproteobacteria bacterium RIFOXYC1_FULL_56_13]OGH07925.1 MAG: V-type ATP synthase subunit B [Candidatus Lambdaproteobacteria bacterium RIFOXYD1_FULL_56_27]
MERIYNRILQIAGNVIMVEADGPKFGELARIESAQGTSLAEVIKVDHNQVFLQVFSGTAGVSTQDRLKFLGHGMQAPFSPSLLGRIFDGKGTPRDAGPNLADSLIETAGPCVNPATRVLPSKMIRTGIPMIDLFNSLVEAQKISIFSSSGEPHNALLARIALQAEVDIIVLGCMGVLYDDYLFFKEQLENTDAMNRTVLFVHTASDPVVEALKVPDLALAVAENFALQGKRVLTLLTDMTNFADALKEIAIIMEQVPSNRGYPGDLYTQLAQRYEKAADFKGAGSLTLVSVTTMPGNDVTHPVPDNTGYITEGQYYLNGGRIEPFGSLSRLKQLVNKNTRSDHRAIMDAMIQLYASSRETEEKRAMGFKMSPWDQKLLLYNKLFAQKLMDLEVNIPLEGALDLCWSILAQCFTPEETRLKSELIAKYWPTG